MLNGVLDLSQIEKDSFRLESGDTLVCNLVFVCPSRQVVLVLPAIVQVSLSYAVERSHSHVQLPAREFWLWCSQSQILIAQPSFLLSKLAAIQSGPTASLCRALFFHTLLKCKSVNNTIKKSLWYLTTDE